LKKKELEKIGFTEKSFNSQAGIMVNGKQIGLYILSIAGLIMLGGCSSTISHTKVFKDTNVFNTRIFDVSKDQCYQIVKEVGLGNGFRIVSEDISQGKIEFEKYFQERNRTISITLQINLTSVEETKTKVHLNAFQTTQALYRSRSVTHLLIIPIPTGVQASTVKEKQQTIEDKRFYNAFFTQIEDYIKKELNRQK